MKKQMLITACLVLVLLAAGCTAGSKPEPGTISGRLIGPKGPQSGTVKMTTFADQACVDLANKTGTLTAEEKAAYDPCHQQDAFIQTTSEDGTYAFTDLTSGFYQVNFTWTQNGAPDIADSMGLGFSFENRPGYLIAWFEPTAGETWTALAIGEIAYFDAATGAIIDFDYGKE